MTMNNKDASKRTCIRCGIPYQEDLFYHYHHRKGQPFADCKACRRVKENGFRRTPLGVGRRLLEGCKKRGDLVTIDEAWVMERIIKGVCEVTGLPLKFDTEGGRRAPFTPSIDQKVPGMGYTEANAQLVCWIYNISKCDWSHDDVMTLATALAGRSVEAEMAE